ncbi:MAG: hypothetical protein Q7T11_07790 [Deltaproteobacteria bacterium]|nr:hypothetical protein [Deltaproteobacteria bacterium]
MADPTIDNKPVENPDTLEGLQNILKSEPLKKLHDGNPNFTEQELGALLDIDRPAENTLDAIDGTCHDLRKTGLTFNQFETLAKEYHARFPKGEKRVSNSIWGKAPVDGKSWAFEPDRPRLNLLGEAPSPQGRSNGLWKPDELLNPQVVQLIGTNSQLEKGDFRISYDSEYKVLRVNNISSWDLAFNIWLDDQGNIKGISRDDVSDRGLFTQTVLDLERDGIFLPGTAPKLGISAPDIESATKSRELFLQLGQINNSNIASLPASSAWPIPMVSSASNPSMPFLADSL